MEEINVQLKEIQDSLSEQRNSIERLIVAYNNQAISINSLVTIVSTLNNKLSDMEIKNHYSDESLRDIQENINQLNYLVSDLKLSVDKISLYNGYNSSGGW